MTGIDGVLALWDMPGAVATPFARRENEVWRVVHDGAAYALRFHRPGYRTGAELRSELDWMSALADAGLPVPRPVPLVDGQMTGQAGDRRVSLLTWLPGGPIGAVGALRDGADPYALCHAIGALIARLHDLTDAWTPPTGFTRPDWRADGLLGDRPLWGRFWDHPHLSGEDRAVLLDVRARAADRLGALDGLDQGLIHADLLAENIMQDGAQIAFIDFDDCAIGYRDFELATFLIKFLDQPYYGDMRRGVCDGYAARRAVDPDRLDFFLLLRALTYPGWIMSRLTEPGGAERSRRALDTALTLARGFQSGAGRGSDLHLQ